MNFQRLTSLAVLVSFTGLMFSGCFEKPPTQKTQKPAKVELVYYKLFDDEDVMNPLIQQYQSEHPNVVINYRKFTDPAEYEKLIVNELAEGEGPDIFSMPNSWFLRNSKKLTPLDPKVFSPKGFAESFVRVAENDLVLADQDGNEKVYGIPLTVDTLALYYNKSFFEDKIPSRGRPAETWEELKEDVFKLTKKDNSFERFELSGIALGRSDNLLRALDVYYLMMIQYGVKFYNDNYSQAVFAQQKSITPAGVSITPAQEALKLFTSFALPSNKNYSWNSYLADPNSATKEIDTFAKGKVAMIFGYSYLYQQILDQVEDLKSKGIKTINISDIKIAPAPQVNDPKTSTQKRDAYANYFAETVSRTSEHSDVAWDFLLFISSKENLKFYNEKTHRPTSRRDMIDDQMKDPVYGVFAEQIGYAESLAVYDTVFFSNTFAKAMNSVLATVSVNDALQLAQSEINSVLPSEGLSVRKKAANTSDTQEK